MNNPFDRTTIARLERPLSSDHNREFSQASRFSDRRDVFLVGYRGMDGSSVLDCPEV